MSKKQSFIPKPIKKSKNNETIPKTIKQTLQIPVETKEEIEKWKPAAQCSSTDNLRNIIKARMFTYNNLEDLTRSITKTDIILQGKIKTIYLELVPIEPIEPIDNITSSIENDETLDNMEKFNEENVNEDNILDETTISNDKLTPEILESIRIRNEIQQQYHVEIINELDTAHKALLKAPTGFGKTVIIFKIINHYSPKITLFLTPRRNLNYQTMEDKDKILTNGNFTFYNYSPDPDINKSNEVKCILATRKEKEMELKKIIRHRLREDKNIIIVSCFQSCRALLPLLYQSNIQINLVICDEAHFIDTWGLMANESHRLLLDDRKLNETEHPFIENRLFVTATPKEAMNEGQFISIFGKKIEKVQIYELINHKILCDFEVIIKEIEDDTIPDLKEEVKAEDVDVAIIKRKVKSKSNQPEKLKLPKKLKNSKKLKLDLAHFIHDCMKEKDKKKGIIYLNSQHRVKHFYAYFKRAYSEFDVFIYISDKVSQRTFNELKTPDGTRYNDIIFNSDHTNIDKFKECVKPCIIITCNKLSYGFDELKVDLLCLADARQGEEDLRQIFGRGARNNLAIYPNKILHIIIPVYKDELFNEEKYPDGKIEQEAKEIEVLDEEGNTKKQQLQEDRHKGFVNIRNFLLFILNECGKDIINGFIVSSSKLKELPKDVETKPDGIVYNPVNSKNVVNPDFKGDKIPGVILKALSSTHYGSYTKFMGFLRINGVYNEMTYNAFRTSCTDNEWMPILGDIRKTYIYKKFSFQELGAKENAEYYQTLEECEGAYKECLRLFAEESNCSISKLKSKKTEQQLNKKIFEMNSRIPINRNLFYPIV